jgi:hypothetical protein
LSVDRRECPNLDLRAGDESTAAFSPAAVHVIAEE